MKSFQTGQKMFYQKNQVCRAGVLPYFRDRDGYLFFLLGQDSETNNWADLGGTTESGETVLETALREYGEESRRVLPVNPNDFTFATTTPIQSKNGLWSEQAFFFVPVELTRELLNINSKFQQTSPKSVYEEEMRQLAWIDLDTIMTFPKVSRTLKALRPVLCDLQECL